MLEALRPMLLSKKFQMAIVAMILWLAGRFGMNFSAEAALAFVSPLMTAIAGQGVADLKKPCAACSKSPANENQPPPPTDAPAVAA